MKSKIIVTILIIILLAVYYLLRMDYMKQQKEQEALTSQIAEVSQTISEIPALPQDLELRLAVAQESLADEQNAFPGKMNSTQVINTILELADDCEVEAIPLVTQPWSMEKVGEHSYFVFRLNVTVEGSLSQLLTFIGELENGELETLVVEDLSVTGDSPQSEEEDIAVIASLNLTIYAQPLSFE